MDHGAERGRDFWSFALSFYAHPGISPLCLRLQSEGDTDVMLLIAHCFCAKAGAPLSATEIETLRRHMADWRKRAVLPLRALRIDLRTDVDHLSTSEREAFRDRLKQVELAAEKVQAGMIAHWFAQRSAHEPGDFARGLHSLAGDAALSADDVTLLRQAVDAA